MAPLPLPSYVTSRIFSRIVFLEMSLDSELLDLALQSSGEASQHTSKLIRRLRVVMITEKCAPELLMYEDELMQDIAKVIEDMVIIM